MATTDQSTEQDAHVFSATSWLPINPETIDAAVVEQSLVRDGTRSIVNIRWRGFDMQSYGCDPLDVAAAFARLANRIADAALDSRAVQP